MLFYMYLLYTSNYTEDTSIHRTGQVEKQIAQGCARRDASELAKCCV